MFTMISILWMYYWHANEIMIWVIEMRILLVAAHTMKHHDASASACARIDLLTIPSQTFVFSHVFFSAPDRPHTRSKSNKLTDSMYASTWYGESGEYRKAAHLFMLCTQQPITMKTVFLELNLNNFISVSALAFSRRICPPIVCVFLCWTDFTRIVQLLYTAEAAGFVRRGAPVW